MIVVINVRLAYLNYGYKDMSILIIVTKYIDGRKFIIIISGCGNHNIFSLWKYEQLER